MFLQNFNTRCLTYSLNTLFQWFSTMFLDVIMLTTPLNYSIVTEEKCFNFFVLNFLVFLQWKQAKSFKNVSSWGAYLNDWKEDIFLISTTKCITQWNYCVYLQCEYSRLGWSNIIQDRLKLLNQNFFFCIKIVFFKI